MASSTDSDAQTRIVRLIKGAVPRASGRSRNGAQNGLQVTVVGDGNVIAAGPVTQVTNIYHAPSAANHAPCPDCGQGNDANAMPTARAAVE